MRYLNDFIFGLILPFKAAILGATNPKLWPWMMLPFILTLGAYYLLWTDLFLPWQQTISEISSNSLAGLFGIDSYSNVKSGLQTLITILLAAFFWIAALFCFSTLSNLATLPVNDFLAESVEPLCVPPLKRDYPGGLFGFLSALWVDLRKSIVSIILILITFIFSWIPIMNVFAILLVALALTLQYSGYASTRRGFGVRASLILCVKNLPLSLGFGLACMMLLSIPIINLIIPTLAVIGGTMLFSRLYSVSGPR